MGAARDKPTKQRQNAAIRFPEELYDELREAAEDRDLSINFLVVTAVKDFLQRLLPADQIRWTRESG